MGCAPLSIKLHRESSFAPSNEPLVFSQVQQRAKVLSFELVHKQSSDQEQDTTVSLLNTGEGPCSPKVSDAEEFCKKSAFTLPGEQSAHGGSVKSAWVDDAQKTLKSFSFLLSGEEARRTSILILQKPEDELFERHNQVVVGESNELQTNDPVYSRPTKSYPKRQKDRKLILKCLESQFVFSSFSPESLDAIVNDFAPELVSAGGTLENENDDHRQHKFYIVKSALIEVSQSGTKDVRVLSSKGNANAGQCFGALALMVNVNAGIGNKFTLTVTASGMIFTLTRRQFQRRIVEQTKIRVQKLRAIVKHVELLDGLTDSQVSTLANHLVPVTFTHGQTIIKEGECAKNFYVIEQGTVTMHKGRDHTELSELCSGDFFGEHALLSMEPRVNTYRAKGTVLCLCLGRDQFAGLLNLKQLRQPVDDAKMELCSLDTFDLKKLKIVRYIGKGSFGLVAMAKRKGDKTADPVALKRVEKNYLCETGQMYSIVREKKIMQILCRHPHIVKLYGTCSDAHSLYFVIEYLAGGHVYHWLWLNKLKFSLERTRLYSACIADSLIYMHKKNILYRDLKLENVCLDHQGMIKIIDFGLSKQDKDNTFTTAGTPEYMAPEMFMGSGHHKGVDYWALGIAIYEMLCGFTTFGMWEKSHAPTDMQVFARAAMKNPKFPPTFDEPAKKIVCKLLQKQSHDRLGCIRSDGQGLREDPFYAGIIPWEKVKAGTIDFPWKPSLNNRKDDISCHRASIHEKFKEHVPSKYIPSDDGNRYEILWKEHFPLSPSA